MRARAAALAAVAVAVPGKAEPAQARCVTHKCWHRVHVRRQHHWIRHHYWRWARAHLSSSTRGMLFRLGPLCETKGKSDYVGYRWSQHFHPGGVWNGHDGRYQYDVATWASAGGHGHASDASPAEQDVRTARYYPSHRYQWECRA